MKHRYRNRGLLTGVGLAALTLTAGAQTQKPLPTAASKQAAPLNNLATASRAVGVAIEGTADTPKPQVAAVPNATGKFITTPALGTVTNVGSLPFNLVASPDGKFAVSTNIGYQQYLSVINTATGALASQLDYNNGLNGGLGSSDSGLYYGLVFSPVLNGDGTYTLYSAQGSFSRIEILKMNATTGALSSAGFISSKINGDFVTGLDISADGKTLYAVNNEFYGSPAANDLLSPGSVSMIDVASKTEVGRYNFSAPLPNFPLPIAAVGTTLYVGSQRDGVVYVIDASNPAAPKLGTTPYGSGAIPADTALNLFAHPIALLKSKANPGLLFIGGAHSDKLIVVNTATNAIVNAIPLQPQGTGAANLPGATPTGIAEAANGLLYVTLGDMNAVAVVNPGVAPASAVLGYLPVGWYPTGAVFGATGNLLVTNAKGHQTRYPNPSYVQYAFALAYDLNLIEGDVQTIANPLSLLATGTPQVLANNRIANIPTTNPLAAQAAQIKHVIYIVKENRTFDQVLGDIGVPGAIADPTLTLFGAGVTPNLHALAKRFVLLDNFFDCGEASGDGWPWSTQGQATEYVIKNLPYNYSGRGRNYDFEGQNNGYPVGGFGPGLSAAFPNGAPAIPDVSEAPGHHIWDDVLAHGLTYRNYGFFYSFGVAGLIPDNYPGGTALIGRSDTNFRRFDGNYADSEIYQSYGLTTPLPTYGANNAPSRYTEWNTEFTANLAADPTGNSVPNFQTIRFMKDHTSGYYPNQYSPQSMVADNDYAVGQLVDRVSHSAIWNSTAIFIIEDDSQDGPDHIDTHRSTCYVISPLIKRASLDHTFYNTDSVLKSMELLMGLPPMNQYDAVADYINDFDTTAGNSEPYTAIKPSARIVGRKTPGSSAMRPGSPQYKLAQQTKGMDFVHPDSANPKLLNEILWKSVKGFHAKMPAIKHDPRIAAKLGKKAAAKSATNGKKAATARKDDDD